MSYAKIENGVVTEWPLEEGDLDIRFPDLVFPLDSNLEVNGGVLCPEGYVRVEQPDPITTTEYNVRYEMGMPHLINGVWKEVRTAIPYTDEEKLKIKNNIAQKVREQRDSLLKVADAFVVIDRWSGYTDQQKLEWTDYRQELRDVSTQTGFPFNVIWPIEPSLFDIRKF